MPIFGKKKNKRYLPIDYHQKKLENPFFKRKDRIIPLTGLKAKLTIILIVLFLVFIIWFLFISSFWKVKEILISGINPVTAEEVRGAVIEQTNMKTFLFIPQKNLLFFKEKNIRETLKGKYRFQKIIISKRWPNRLAIEIAEKPLACIWIEDGKYFYTDTDGYVVQEISPLELKDKKYPLISNESGQKIYASKTQTDLTYIQAAAQIYEKISTQTIGTTIDRFIIDNEIDTLKAQTPSGLKISFDTKSDINKQLERLYVLKAQKLKDDFALKTKIDLRFGDKIYYQ